MYTPTIGLEIHAELKTRTKMFCACLNDPDEKTPNKNICPVCLAHPGTLPVINKEAVHKILLVGRALNGTLATETEFDRKSYFYPDIPKGYQISQFERPLVSGGSLLNIEITRVHLEEDTARSQHQGGKSIVDYNRAGVPLMELVTEPVIHDAKTAGNFARELQLLMRTLGAGEANMEKGEMRVEANISVSATNGSLGTKVEVKNLNSFRSVERAIAYEIERQTGLLKKGEEITQETRGWDEQAEKTFSQRKKESSHDYRYFPDPDLPKLILTEIEEFKNISLPELPAEKRKRYLEQGSNEGYVDMFVSDTRFGGLFEKTVALYPQLGKPISSVIGSDIAGLVSQHGDEGLKNITPEGLGSVVFRFNQGKVSSRGMKDATAEVFTKGGDLAKVSENYLQQSDSTALLEIAHKVIGEYPNVVEDYKKGKESALQYLVGQGMKESKGSANPSELQRVLLQVLG